MECQVEKNEHFRHLLVYEFNRGSKAAEAARNICAVYGEDSIAERTAQKWFAHCKQCNFDMSDTPLLARMLSIWLDIERIIHYELLERNLTVTSERYCPKLCRLKEAIQQKRPVRLHGMILQHDNARPHTANMTKAAIQNSTVTFFHIRPTLWTLPHRITTSSGLSLQQSARLGISFNNDAGLQNWLDDIFMAKPADLFKCGIENLPKHWEAVVSNGGEYIID
jgi:hypothetical protein